LEFDSAFFRAMELSEQVVADPLYKLVCPYRGWVHGFVESEFRAWLGNPELGPLAGPHLRPFFHEIFRGETVLRLSPDVLTVEQEQPIKEGQTADARDTERFAAPNGAAAKPADASSGDHANQRGGRRRALYRGALVEWMASQELRILNKMDVRAIAQAFKSYCEKDKPELVPRLPQRLRDMFKVIEGHIRHRETKAAEAKRRATKSH
jgi:hypothetical protein